MNRRIELALVAGIIGVVLAVLAAPGQGPAVHASSPATSVAPAPLPAIEPPTGGPMDGAFVTRLSNVVVETNEPIRFDHPVSDAHGIWDEGTALVVPRDGWWRVAVNLTTLGTAYGGPSNAEVLIAVVANWDGETPPLTSYVASERFYNHPSGRRAEINSIDQLVWLEEGDRLEVLTVSGSGALLVESNPSDGLGEDGEPVGYEADRGPGTLSPHFSLAAA